jgi:hypothetical protein
MLLRMGAIVALPILATTLVRVVAGKKSEAGSIWGVVERPGLLSSDG